MIKLSVIIPTRNRAHTLERALVSIAQQTLSKNSFEVIVVDNGSTDDTADVCARVAGKFQHFVRLYDDHPGLHVGRHLGMKHARSEILVYGDDDIEAKPEWLDSVAQTFEQSEVVLVGGKNLPILEVPPPEWVARMWAPNASGDRVCGPLSILDLGDVPRRISPYRVFGCNLSIRKSVLLDAGGFHPDGMPRDLIRLRGDGETHVSRFVERRELVTFYHPGASVGHCVPRERLSLEYFCERSFNQGVTDSFAELRLHGGPAGPRTRFVRVLRAIRRQFRRWWAPFPQARLSEAWQRGFRFHQDEYRRDPALREWVRRPDYLGEDGQFRAAGRMPFAP